MTTTETTEVVERVDLPDGCVVVGIDGSQPSSRALRWAADYARCRGGRLAVVRAWSIVTAPRPVDGPPGYVPSLPEFERAVREDMRLQARAVLGDDMGVEFHPLHGRPAAVLVQASATAAHLAIGARGREGFLGLLLGSVSDELVRHSRCPVTVVHPDDDGARARG